MQVEYLKTAGGITQMSDLNTLIGAHWQAKANLEAAKKAEKDARDALSDFLNKDEQSLKNHTLTLSGGWKLKHEVARTLKVNKSHEAYKSLPTILTPEQLDALVREKRTLEYNYSAFVALPKEIIEQLTPFISVNEAVAIKYDQPTDNR